MGIEIALAVGGLALSAYGSVKQQQQAKKAEKAQKNVANEQKKLNDAQATRERQKTVREAIRRQAIIANSAGVSGTLGSSAAQGGIGGLSSEAGGNVGYINTVTNANNRISDLGFQAQKATNSAATYGQISELGFAAVSNANSIGNFLSTTFAPSVDTVTPKMKAALSGGIY